MSHNPHDWSDGIPDCIIFASTADAERGAAMYRSMADALDAKDARIKELEGALREIARGMRGGQIMYASECWAIASEALK